MGPMIEHVKLPSLSRLFRDMTITEKIDGTQSGIHFEKGVSCSEYVLEAVPLAANELYVDGYIIHFAAQSKNRLITPEDDNYGFARWVYNNAADLYALLGEGSHFGEWWGQGIQRRYGQDHKRFSLFNVERYKEVSAVVGGSPVEPVPVLYSGPFDTDMIVHVTENLKDWGSVAAPAFKDPEGVVVFHHHSGKSFKFTLDNNDKHKWEAVAAGA